MEQLNNIIFFQSSTQPYIDKNLQTTDSTTGSIFKTKNNVNNTAYSEEISTIDYDFSVCDKNEENNTETKLNSNNNQEDYNFEEDAIQTAIELKELIYDVSLDRSEKVLEFFENNLDPANIDIVLEEYKNLTGERSIQEDLNIILLLHPFKKNKINKILDSLLNFENLNTKINNEYWQGDPHDVIRKGSTITITNTKTNDTKTLNLATLLKNFNTSEERKRFTEQLQNLPAEVLMDIAAEQTTLIELDSSETLNLGNNKTCNATGYYDPSSDQVALQSDCKISNIVHETGHALDYNRLSGENKSSAQNSKNFTEIFNEELEKYLADGNKIYDYDKNTKRETYATANKREMFAECYTLLMTGDCGSKATIEKYFPRMLSYVKQYIEYNRSHSDSIRH